LRLKAGNFQFSEASYFFSAGDVVRVISAREANSKERLVYEAFKGIPVP